MDLLVADSGPLIALARLDLLALPARIFTEVLVTAMVWSEVTRAPRIGEHEALAAALDAGSLHLVDGPAEVSAVLADPRLDEGERSALALAMSRRATVLIDEHRGRTVAAAAGLSVIGTLGLLMRARELQMIGPVRPLIDALLASGYYLSRPLVERALGELGE